MDTNENQLYEPPKTEEEPAPPAEPSRLTKFLRLALRWAIAVLGVFALGVVATWFVQVRPKAYELDSLRAEVESANAEIEELQDQLADLEGVEDELADSRLHQAILGLLVDVSSAQLALKEGNLETAQAALAETDDRLADLGGLVSSAQQATVEGMRERLALVLGEIEEDAFAAESDLDVLRNSLLALERSLFGE